MQISKNTVKRLVTDQLTTAFCPKYCVIIQHNSANPSSAAGKNSLKTALEWFESQYGIAKDGAPKNINTMSPFYCLSGVLADGQVKDKRWLKWCDEWAEWVMNDLPRTKDGGFQHSESEVQSHCVGAVESSFPVLCGVGKSVSLLTLRYIFTSLPFFFLVHACTA